MSPLRALLAGATGGVTAAIVRTVSRGRITGTSYRVHRPGRVRVSSSGRIVVGDGTVVEADARVTVDGARLTLGRGVFIGKNATITAYSDVVIDDRALLAENVSIHSENHGGAQSRDVFTSAPIVIGAGAWLGAGVVVTAGVTIGAGATIGANAVVTKDVPAGATAVGVPARVLPGRQS